MAEVTHEQVPTNGIELHVAAAGPADGPPVVLCHGFPELWYSWRHQLGALADAGYRAYAPDLRGYGGSSHPTEVDDYGSDKLTGDLCGLLDHYGYDTRRLRGARLGRHGRVGAGAPAPDTRLVPLQHERPLLERPGAARPDLRGALRRQVLLHALLPAGRAGRGRVRGRPPTLPAHHALLRRAQGMAHAGPLVSDAPREGTRFQDILTPAPDVLPPWITEADVDVYAAAFEKGGFFGPVSFYRNMDANWERSHDIPASVYTMPTGFLTGVLDPVALMMPDAAEEMAAALPDYRGTTVVEGAAHWVQQEKPAETNAALLAFLSSV